MGGGDCDQVCCVHTGKGEICIYIYICDFLDPTLLEYIRFPKIKKLC